MKDLNTCGACLEVANYGTFFLDKLDEPYFYLKLLFPLPDEIGKEKRVEVIGRVVIVRKSWKKISVGILFMHKTGEDARRIESFYPRGLSSLDEPEEKPVLNAKFL